MDISMDIHIHGNPDNTLTKVRHTVIAMVHHFSLPHFQRPLIHPTRLVKAHTPINNIKTLAADELAVARRSVVGPRFKNLMGDWGSSMHFQ